MLWSEKFDVIGKTGYTKNSNYCFVGRLNENNKDVFLGILGSKKLWTDVRRLCSYPNAKMLTLVRINQKLWATADVLSIQQSLLNAGYDAGPVDGVFNLRTLTALETFQKDHNIPVDGIVGGQTLSVLSNYR